MEIHLHCTHKQGGTQSRNLRKARCFRCCGMLQHRCSIVRTQLFIATKRQRNSLMKMMPSDIFPQPIERSFEWADLKILGRRTLDWLLRKWSNPSTSLTNDNTTKYSQQTTAMEYSSSRDWQSPSKSLRWRWNWWSQRFLTRTTRIE